MPDDAFTLATLVIVGAIAGFVDAVAGGGGLLAIPALLLAQVPSVQALATNKFQASIGTLAASIAMVRAGKVNLKQIRIDVYTCFLGAIFGTLLVIASPPDYLDIAVPTVLAVVALFFLFAPNPGTVETQPRTSSTAWRLSIPVLGFYDGYFGPGTGMFLQMAQVWMRGRTLIKATANAKVLNLASNAAALGIFVAGGQVAWAFGCAMMLGQVLGGYLGAKAAIAYGSAFIRTTVVVACLAMLGQILWQTLAD